MTERPDHRAIVASLPTSPGVYIFRDGGGRALYVGKAKNLRKRVASYFRTQVEPEWKLGEILERFATVETIATASEIEALVLENDLVKEFQPGCNTLLKDDKTFPFIRVTTGDEWPRAFVTRRVAPRDGSRYFGPYVPARRARRLMELLRRYFRICTCRREFGPGRRATRPCLYYEMKACAAPCVPGVTTEAEYRTAVEEAILLLRGKNRELVAHLGEQMRRASEALEFELASHYRDLLQAIREERVPVSVHSIRGEDVDVVGVHEAEGNVAAEILFVRGGLVVGRRQLFREGEPGNTRFDLPRFLASVLQRLYDPADFVPRAVHLPAALQPDEEHLISEWLRETSGRAVTFHVPRRGLARRRLDLAVENARLAWGVRFRARARGDEALGAIERELSLAAPPRRIEGFDVSHLVGGDTFASCVVFEDGRPAKRLYRTFMIAEGRGDDLAAMREAISRRYRRQIDEGAPLPDLVLVDGGLAQLEAARIALGEVGADLPMASLAKREEEVFVPGRVGPIVMSRASPALKLLQHVRDEAHRFALAAHRRRRERRSLASGLEGIPGIGTARIRALLRAFHGTEGVARASLEELATVVGRRLASRIREARVERGPESRESALD